MIHVQSLLSSNKSNPEINESNFENNSSWQPQGSPHRYLFNISPKEPVEDFLQIKFNQVKENTLTHMD